MIKYNIKTVNDWLYNSNPIKGMYYNGRRVYRRFVANGQPTPPVFDGKWKAKYLDGRVTSAECDSSSAVTYDDFRSFNTQLESVEIGDCVTSIGTNAFRQCHNLTSVTIPNSVTTIGNGAFLYDANLLNVVIPDSITSIGVNAFNQCYSLTSLDIPDSVTSIGGTAFRFCSGLTSVTVEATTPPSLGTNVFGNTSSNLVIYVPDASVDIYKSATNWSSYASRIKPLSEKPQ